MSRLRSEGVGFVGSGGEGRKEGVRLAERVSESCRGLEAGGNLDI